MGEGHRTSSQVSTCQSSTDRSEDTCVCCTVHLYPSFMATKTRKFQIHQFSTLSVKFYCPLNNSSGAREGRAGAVRAVKAKARQAAGTGTNS